MNKLAMGLSLVAALAVQSANAGADYPANVTISADGLEASGSVTTAHNSSDNNQYIACSASHDATYGDHVYCHAQDASGNSMFCFDPGPSVERLIITMAVNQSSFIDFGRDSDNRCTFIAVDNGSYHL